LLRLAAIHAVPATDWIIAKDSVIFGVGVIESAAKVVDVLPVLFAPIEALTTVLAYVAGAPNCIGY